MLFHAIAHHDDAFPVNLADDACDGTVVTLEHHLCSNSQLTNDLQGLLILQFINTLTDIAFKHRD